MKILLVNIFIIHHCSCNYSSLQYYIWRYVGEDQDHNTYCDRHHFNPRYYDNKKANIDISTP